MSRNADARYWYDRPPSTGDLIRFVGWPDLFIVLVAEQRSSSLFDCCNNKFLQNISIFEKDLYINISPLSHVGSYDV